MVSIGTRVTHPIPFITPRVSRYLVLGEEAVFFVGRTGPANLLEAYIGAFGACFLTICLSLGAGGP